MLCTLFSLKLLCETGQYYDVLTNYFPVFVTPQFRAITNDNVLEAQLSESESNKMVIWF